MLRIFLFSLLLLPVVPVCAQSPATASAKSNSASPAIAVDKHGENVYLVGTGFRTAADTGSGQNTGDGLNITCAIPVPAVKVSFIFADGSHYEYIPKEAFGNTSFAVLLRGEMKLPDNRRGIGRLFGHSKRIYGDEALLQRLQTRELQSVRYEQEKITYWDGKAIKAYGPAQTYTNPTEFETMRSELLKLAQ